MQTQSNKIVSVVVVTYGINGYLESCLDSLKAQTQPGSEVIVIDNSLDPGFGDGILRKYPFIALYKSKENLFYCGGLNKGIGLSHGEFILCLNDDVVLDAGFIEKALEGFKVFPGIGMVSGKILRRDAKTVDSCGLNISIWRTARERGYNSRDSGIFQRPEFIFGVNGAAAFYRRAMLEDILQEGAYFDPDFRFFYEDLDLAWRAQRRGWKGYYLPGAIVYHLRGGSVRNEAGLNKPYARRFLNDSLHADLIKNRYLTIIKNESLPSFLLLFPFIALYDLFVWAYVLFFRSRLIKILLPQFKYFKAALRKRKAQ